MNPYPHKQLLRLLQTQHIPHALLFCGPKVAEKEKMAYWFSKELLKCEKKLENHPDIHLLFPEGKTGMHAIDTIRTIAQDAALAPFDALWKIFIIHDADKMLPASSNALLKTLEEPPPHTVIILLSDYPERLLPTILSRCQSVRFTTQREVNIDPLTLNLLCENLPRSRFAELDSKESDPDVVFETLLLWYRDSLLLEIGGDLKFLHFPQHINQIKQNPFIPFEKIEKVVNQIRLASQRATKLSACLEMFRLHIENHFSENKL